MLIYFLAVMAAQTPQVSAAVLTSQAQSAAPAKKKRAPEQCSGDEAALGSHIAMPCSQPDEFERLRQAHQAEQAMRFNSIPRDSPAGNGPH